MMLLDFFACGQIYRDAIDGIGNNLNPDRKVGIIPIPPNKWTISPLLFLPLGKGEIEGSKNKKIVHLK